MFVMGGQKTRDTGVMNEFGKHLRTMRRNKNLTQEDLAVKAGVSISQVARIESGKLNTTISTIVSLARALDVEPGDLFKW
jgi:transcriptional regulator with XRE-family HTH domain